MPPAARPTSATPGPSSSSSNAHNALGDAIYNWCRDNPRDSDVYQQSELLASGLIPGHDPKLLLAAVTHLVNRRLFRTLDVKGTTNIAFQLVKEEDAARYIGLSSDEQMVYQSIDAAGTAGLWTKTIKAKSGAHAKVLDGVYKSLEKRQLIKQMKSVKHPQRKMYIKFTLTPSEDATGGTWYNDGKLDVGMIEAISQVIEYFCSSRSFRQREPDLEEDSPNSKRKQPNGGFEDGGSGKAIKTENGKHVKKAVKGPPHFDPMPLHYQNYPTVDMIAKDIADRQVTQIIIPNSAIKQLLEIMVYDNRLFRIARPARVGEFVDDEEKNIVYMYRNFNTLADLNAKEKRRQKIEQEDSSRYKREQELEDIGIGGFSEVPCLDCPNFDDCGEGGPINVKTCHYLPDWQTKMERADRDVDPWPEISIRNQPRPRHK